MASEVEDTGSLLPFETVITVIYYAESTEAAHKAAQGLGEGIFQLDFVEQVEVEKPRRLGL